MEEEKSTKTEKTKSPKGAGGTEGGIRDFFIGLMMAGVGFYMLLSKITVTSGFGMGRSLYRFGSNGGTGGFGLTTGMIFIPMIIGIMWIFYNAKSIFAWLLASTSFAGMVFGVISSVTIRMTTMSSFDLIVILVLSFGGIGIFLRSLRKIDKIVVD